jgi:outer membrane protein assembly factor BamA
VRWSWAGALAAALFAVPLAAAILAAPARVAAAAEAGRADPQPPGSDAPEGAPAGATVPPATHLIDQESLDAAALGKKIGNVRIVTRNIFDLERPGEGRLLFRLANHLHRTTRHEVIERQLLFQPGDPFSPETVRETERLLRSQPYFYDVAIRPVGEDANKVDLEVLTRDVWTLQAGVNFHRAGGTNSTTFDVEDENFLGSGKNVLVARQSDIDRTQNIVRYRDPSLAGSRALLDLTFADNSDGNTRVLDAERPFYALDTRWAAGVSLAHDNRIDPLYDGGEITDRFRDRHDFMEIYGGLSPGLTDGVTHRFRFGYTYDRSEFSTAPFVPLAGEPTANPLLAGAPLAANRRLAYPWIGYELVEDGFITLHNFDRIHRTEDVNLGRVVSARLGWSAPAFGGDVSRLIVHSTASEGWVLGPRQILLVHSGLSGRLRDGKLENAQVGGALRFYRRTFGNGLLVLKLAGDMAEKLDLENQLLLGGDNGLRGYPLRYQDGDRRFLATLEQRFYGEHEYFHLVHLGAAAFFDVGRAWYTEPPPTALLLASTQRQVLKDVGIGMRLGSSRSSQGSLVHIDLAFPLDRNRAVKAMQFLVTTSQTF